MHRSMKRTIILLAVGGVTLVATFSCQPCRNEASLAVPTELPEAQPANNLELRGDGNTLIKPIEVARGASADFKVTNGTAYVLIPDRQLTVVVGKKELSAVEGILAFIVGGNGATIKVPEDYRTSDRATVIHYSVLCFDKTGAVYYGEDESPPRIIIPKLP